MGTWALYHTLILIIDKIEVVGYFSIFITFFLYSSPIQILCNIIKGKYNNNYLFFCKVEIFLYLYILACLFCFYSRYLFSHY